MMAKNGRDKLKKKMSCMSASSCNQSIYFHLAMHVLNTLFRGSVSRACVLTHAINTSNKRMNGLEKLFIASLFSQPKLEMRNVTIRGRNLFIFFSLPRQPFERSSS